MAPLLICRDLECRLGRQDVLRGLSLQLEVGQSLALVGASGSGKSTLLRIIAGLEVPERGEVVIEQRLASKDRKVLIPPHRRSIAMLFQDAALWPNLSVGENVSLGLAGQRLAGEEAKRRAGDALTRCELADLSMRLPRTLSGGQQQRAALARALATQPRLLLLDEPFGGLDLLTKQSVVQGIAQLKSQLGFAMIVVTHDRWEVESLCQQAAFLNEGRIVELGRWVDIIADPQTDLAKAMASRGGTPGVRPAQR